MNTTKTINELLVRFDDEGKFQGAHVVYLYRTVDPDTGKQVTASLGTPQAVAKANEADRAALAAVVGEALVALAEAKEAAEATIAEKDAALTAKAAELAEKDAVLNDATTAKDEAEKRAAEYAAELAAKMLADQAPQEGATA